MVRLLWSLSGQHTGLTDLPLTETGERNAQRLRRPIERTDLRQSLYQSFTSRAGELVSLLVFGSGLKSIHDLVEWDYGEYEGRRSVEIHAERPDWQLFRDGCPGGESPQQVAARADRVVELVRSVSGNVLLFPVDISFECWSHAGCGVETLGAQIFHAEYRKPERAGLRTQSCSSRQFNCGTILTICSGANEQKADADSLQLTEVTR